MGKFKIYSDYLDNEKRKVSMLTHENEVLQELMKKEQQSHQEKLAIQEDQNVQ